MILGEATLPKTFIYPDILDEKFIFIQKPVTIPYIAGHFFPINRAVIFGRFGKYIFDIFFRNSEN